MIISECGQNHCGNFELAKEMIRLSRENGADLVKFQLFDPDKLYTPDFKLYKEVKQAELSFDQAHGLFNIGKLEGIEVFFSVFDIERVKWCEEIGVKRFKLAFSQSNNAELLVALEGKNVIVSLDKYGLNYSLWNNMTRLYCVPKYPTTLKDLDFKDIPFEPSMIGRFNGFSDHTLDLTASKIALARGAQIIERHFAIDKKTGVDAEWSMTPDELKELVRWAKVCEQVL